MAADNELKVVATVDVGAFTSGMKSMQDTVATSTANINESLKSVGTSAVAGEKGVENLRQSLGRSKEASDNAVHATHEFNKANLEARETVMVLGEQIGVIIPRHLARFIAEMEPVQGILTKAFSIVMIVALINELPHLVEKIGEAGEAMAGYDERSKKAYEHALQGNLKLIEENIRFRDEMRQAAANGQEGLVKLKTQMDNNKKATADTAVAARSLLHVYVEHRNELDKLHSTWTKLKGITWNTIDGTEAKIKELNKAIEAEEPILEALQSKMQFELPKQKAEIKSETDKTGRQDQRTMNEARVEANKSADLAIIANAEASTKLLYALRKTSLDSELKDLKQFENDRYDTEVNAAKALLKIKEQEYKEGSAQAGAEAEKLRMKIKVDLAQEHQTKLAEIDKTGFDERLKLQAEANLNLAQAAKIGADALAAQEEAGAQQGFASHLITVEQQTAKLVDAENKRYEALKAVAKAQRDNAAANPTTTPEQLAVLDAQIEANETTHQTKLTSITSAGARTRLEIDTQKMQEQVAFEETLQNRRLQVMQQEAQRRLGMNMITLGQWASQERSALDQWHNDQTKTMDEAIQFAADHYRKDSIEYKKALDAKAEMDEQYKQRKEQIDDEIYQNQQKKLEAMTASFIQNMDAWMQKQETFGQAMAKTWNSMVMQFANFVMKMGIQWALAAALHKQSAAKEIFVDAKVAAAHAFKWAMSAVPFPANIVVAPVLAAAAFAGTMAFAAFEKGGIVPDDQMALVHKREMVLPRQISEFIMNAAGGGASNGTINYNDHTSYSAFDHKDFGKMLEAHRDELADTFHGLINSGRVNLSGAVMG